MALINLRNALMAGKRLPYDAEVEYLESTGTQWIDTGLNYFADFEVGIKLRTSIPNKALGTGTSMCLQRYSANNPYWDLQISGRSYRSSVSIVDYHVMSWRGGVFAADGVTVYTVSNPFASGTMMLFGAGGQPYPNMIYACKLWDANGVLVRDFIPVRKGTVGYLYDRVSGQLFGNAGTGDFLYGADVVPVEYIESHGTEWIDTGVKMRNGLSFDAEFIPTGNSPNQLYDAIYGVYNSSNIGIASLSCIVPADNSGSRYGNRFMDKNPMVPNADTTYKNKRIVYHQANDSFTVSVDGTINDYGALNSTQTAESDATIMLFGIKSASLGNRYAKAKGFFFMISDAGNVANKYLPVRVGTEGAMMDVLTRRIYRNAGTGAFTYGNDLKYPIPAV